MNPIPRDNLVAECSNLDHNPSMDKKLNPLPPRKTLMFCAAAMAAILRDPKAAELSRLSGSLGVSEDQARRFFMDGVGISPKRFAQICCAKTGASSLGSGADVLQASFDAGGSSAGFLHAVSCSTEALTPGEIRSGGLGIELIEGTFPSLLGEIFCARSPRGIVQMDILDFEDNAATERARAALRSRLPQANISPADLDAFDDIAHVLRPHQAPTRLHLLLGGTNFQAQAWLAALAIEPGSQAAYSRIADACGKPKASRAAGTAMASNAIALLIPCHRVIAANGSIGSYKWAPWRKQALIALEKWSSNGDDDQIDG